MEKEPCFTKEDLLFLIKAVIFISIYGVLFLILVTIALAWAKPLITYLSP